MATVKQHVLEQVAELKAELDEYGDSMSVWLPDGVHFKRTGTSSLCATWSADYEQPKAKAWQHLAEDMGDGTEPCNVECEH